MQGIRASSKWAVPLAIVVLLVTAACTREVEVPGETITVEVPVETIVEVPGETITVEVPGETVTVEKIVEVPFEVIVLVTPTPEPVPEPGPSIYKLGLLDEPLTRNFWSFFGGPGGSLTTSYVLDGVATSLYTYSDQRFDWVPNLADGFPSELAQETVDGASFWTTEINLKQGAMWSDGVEITAEDFVFVVDTVLSLGLGGNYGAQVDARFVDHAEAVESHKIKVYFKATDPDGNAQKPGLAVFQFGLGFAPILPEHYWNPIVQAATAAGDQEAQQAALFGHVPENEPTAGGFTFGGWEPGAFFLNNADEGWFRRGAQVTEYAGGAYSEANEKLGYDDTYYGDAEGAVALQYEIGPHIDSEIFNIYGNQDSAVLALINGDIDYLFNSSGLGKGFKDRISAAPDVDIISNPANGVRYLGFNVRKAPMSDPAFRKAVALVIDKEFVAGTILQDAAIPVYAVVPEGNAYWHNADVEQLGKGLSRTDRVTQAVQLLKDAGFAYETEPVMSGDGAFVEVRGEGLKMPDGTLVPELDMLGLSAGYDPLRATFSVWIERWLNDIGIPAKSRLAGNRAIGGTLFSPTVAEDLDMWVLGWSLSLFPSYLDAFFTTGNTPEVGGGFNWGGYSNPEYDALAAGLLAETDLDAARDMSLAMQAFLAEDLPWVTLFTTPILDAYRPSTVEFPYTSVLGGIQFGAGLQQKVLIK